MIKKSARMPVDGFRPRRALGSDGVSSAESGLSPSYEGYNLSSAREERDLKGASLAPKNEGGLDRTALDQALNEIADEPPQQVKKHRKHRHWGWRRVIKWIIILILLAGLGVGGYVASKVLMASNSVFKGSIFGITKSDPLAADSNGRSNILIFGTSEDDPAHVNGGPWLTDSLMIVSIDQTNHNAYTISIPRDLWVKYGKACSAGYEGKINALYQCYSNDGKDDAAGANELKSKIGEVLGMDIQYYVHINYTVVKDAVDAVGGVDVDIESDPVSAGGILDRNFDWACNYTCYYVKYDNGVHHLDGIHALYLARARGDTSPTYGLTRSNFDREINQQKILKALFGQAASVGTLTNLTKVTSLIDAFGSNMRTNFQTSEIRTLVDIAKNTSSSGISSIDVGASDLKLFVSGTYGGQSMVEPGAGLYNYSNIQKYLSMKLSSNPIVQEAAGIGVYNGTTTSGVAQSTANSLEASKYTVTKVSDADKTTYESYTIYDLTNGGKPKTLAALESLYGVKVTSGKPPFTVPSDVDIVVIVGKTTSSQ